jgi:2',3'-cyclic-nucleotide 2'-phosphodiesterase (5'-nucleotidase family)
MLQRFLLYLFLVFIVFSCKKDPSADEITFKFIQLNDVYEIAPLGGGLFGGMSRVAHVRDSIMNVNPNTYLFMAGDFLNPSLLGTIKLDGERLNGKQMVEVMNAMGFDLVTFGNHEFDLDEEDLQKRLNESDFQWVTSNIFQVKEDAKGPFYIQKEDTLAIPESYILSIDDGSGGTLDIGFLSVTLPSNPKDYVHYEDIYSSAKRVYRSLKDEVDLVMGLTHLELDQDRELARQLGDIPFIMGGHEHHSMLEEEGATLISKADANAKTIYIHTFTYNKVSRELKIDSKLFPIDESIASQPVVASIVNRWSGLLDMKIKEVIDDPSEVIYHSDIPLDGTDSANRGIQTNLGDLITQAMSWVYDDEVDAALTNGGSIRIDDMLPNDLTSLDVFRILPFGGSVLKVDLKGKLLNEVLDYGKSKRGTGAYLQRHNVGVDADTGVWLIGGKKIDPDKTYTVAFSDFLLKGYDIPFLTPDNPGVLNIYSPNDEENAYDICKTIILYLKNLSSQS